MSLVGKKCVKGKTRNRYLIASYNTLGFKPLSVVDFDMLYRQVFGYGLRGSSWSDTLYFSGLRYWCGYGIGSAAIYLGWPYNTGAARSVSHRYRLANEPKYWHDWVRLCELCEGFISPIEGYKGRKRVRWDTFLPPCPEKKAKK